MPIFFIILIGIIIASIEFVKKHTEEVISILVCSLVVGVAILIVHILEKYSEKSSYSSTASTKKNYYWNGDNIESKGIASDFDHDELKRKIDFYNRNGMENSFQKWLCPMYYNTHSRKRFDRAKYQSPLFIHLDKDLKGGVCLSTRDNDMQYLVTLRECSCPDYSRNLSPCKHMFALALELGEIERTQFMYGIPQEKAQKLLEVYEELDYVPHYLTKLIEKASSEKNVELIAPDKVVVHIEGSHKAYKLLAEHSLIEIADKNDFDFYDYLCKEFIIDRFKNAALTINPMVKFPSNLRKKELYQHVCEQHPEVYKKLYAVANHIILDTEYIMLKEEYRDFIYYECNSDVPMYDDYL